VARYASRFVIQWVGIILADAGPFVFSSLAILSAKFATVGPTPNRTNSCVPSGVSDIVPDPSSVHASYSVVSVNESLRLSFYQSSPEMVSCGYFRRFTATTLTQAHLFLP
jgi:hypothetical protein